MQVEELLSRHRTLMKFGALALATGLVLGVAACSDDDDDGGDGDSTPAVTVTTASGTPTSETTTTAGGATGAEGETVEITAIDYEFEGLPETVEAGATFELTNDSEEEAHEMVAILLPEDETRSVEELLQLPEEELGELASIEPSFVLIGGPGEEAEAVLGDGTLTEPGRYLFACFIPVGANPDEILAPPAGTGAEGPPDVAGGPPHFTEGMFGEVTVE